ncbi:MAG: hypothetical protein IIY44_00910 [Erysipelotrichales bacterium]|nr:hypothetical protein [Erysipelotrichales bacterium]MBQ2479159.1 hypothetical protein [Erysipelotrichales bacterium]
MADRQILAALEITDHEVRLLVGEYHDTRVNVLRTEIVPVKAMDGFAIKNPSALSDAIKTAAKNASEALGMEIKRVLVAIPSYRVMKNNIRISMGIDNYERKVKIEDLQALVRKGYTYPMPEDKALINWMPLKYYTNRIAFKRMPLDEPCDLLEVELDLYGADKFTSYDYARAVDAAGLEIVDVCLDIYAAAKEAALFELSVNKPVVVTDVEHERTTLAILHNGRIEATKLLETGYGEWEKAMTKAYPISEETAHKLIFQNADLADHLPDDTPVHLWKSEERTHQITVRDLNNHLKPAIKAWADEIAYTAGELFKVPNLQVVLTGTGAELDGLEDYFRLNYGVAASVYYPDTIGVRKTYWTVALGLIYSFVDTYPLYRNKKMSVDIVEPVKKKKKQDAQSEEDDAVTKKLKSFFQTK